jgi:LPXTG-motif cell wall-anchored protein
MIGMGELLVMLVIMAVIFPVWIFALVDAVRFEPETGNERLMWILLIALTGMVGSIVYLVVRRPQRRRQLGH